MNESEARQFAQDLFHGSKVRSTKQSRTTGADAQLAITRRKAWEIRQWVRKA